MSTDHTDICSLLLGGDCDCGAPHRAQVAAAIEAALSPLVGVWPAGPRGELRLADDLGLDSLDLIEVANTLEDVFLGVNIDIDEIDELVTVNDLVQLVLRK